MTAPNLERLNALLKRAADALPASRKDKALVAEIEAAQAEIEAALKPAVDEQQRLLLAAGAEAMRRFGCENGVSVLENGGFNGIARRFPINAWHSSRPPGVWDEEGSAVLVAHPADSKLLLPTLYLRDFCGDCDFLLKWHPKLQRPLTPKEREQLERRWSAAENAARELIAPQLARIRELQAEQARRNDEIAKREQTRQEAAARRVRAWHLNANTD